MRTEAFGASALRRLAAHFGSAEALSRAQPGRLIAAGVSEKTARYFSERIEPGAAEKERALLEKTGVRVIRFGTDGYPPYLAEIPDAPAALFVRGNLDCLRDRFVIALVGTRRMTAYGETVTRLLIEPLAGATIVSGLALGIDAAAHGAALAARTPTVAVLGSGVDKVSVGPRTNLGLAERIIKEGGALISEYPPGVMGDKFRFPMRNRIVAGLSAGVVVVEAPIKSGALITAKAALDYNRDVFVVPGPITQQSSEGSNGLLAQGAIPIVSPRTVPEHYGLTKNAGRDSLGELALSEAQRRMLACVAGGGDADSLIAASGLSPQAALGALAELELAGIIVKSGTRYAIKN